MRVWRVLVDSNTGQAYIWCTQIPRHRSGSDFLHIVDKISIHKPNQAPILLSS